MSTRFLYGLLGGVVAVVAITVVLALSLGGASSQAQTHRMPGGQMMQGMTMSKGTHMMPSGQGMSNMSMGAGNHMMSGGQMMDGMGH